ncbi:MAG: capsular biosynthesis protein, partial [Flavobacterium sp.]
MTTIQNQKKTHEEEGVNLKLLLAKIIGKWPWLLLSVCLCLGIAYLYLRYKTPIYKISARVLVNDEKKGAGMLGGNSLLGDLGGLLGSKSTVDNEAEILKTRYLMEQVVRDMDLNITYYHIGRIRDTELYQSPFKVNMITPVDTILSTKINLKLLKDGRIEVSAKDLDTIAHFNQPIRVPKVGSFIISRVPNQKMLDKQYDFNISSVDEKVASLIEQLEVTVTNKLVTIVDLSINHPLPKKGEDILSKLIHKYVEANLKDKNEVADSTIKFINSRLRYIGTELGDLEGNIQGFKQRNNLADMTEQAKLLVQNSAVYMNDLAKVEIQLSMLNSLQDYLKDGKKRVLPSSLMPADLVFTGLIERYNALLLERDRRLLGLTETNPIILNLDQQIANLRKDMLANLISSKNSLQITRDKLNVQMKAAEGQVKQVPAIERDYLELARQQRIKQELYIFLMQKSEETAISKTSTIANSKTIDPPKSAITPYSPKKPVIGLM